MKRVLLTIAISFSFSQFLSSQINATTLDGDKVLLNENGTWTYVENDTHDATENTELSSDCSSYISTETDKMTGKSSTGANEKLIISEDGGKTGFGILMLNSSSSKSLILSIQAVGAGSCVDDDNKINILFRDGSRLELVNDGKFNCDAKMTLYFGGVFGKKKQLEELAAKEIETMRVWTSKSYVERDFSSAQSKQFMKTISCLIAA
ncbi:hypothetical protein ATE92_0484 [Ulvibacter sp. MAR_2010_11]|uniref:hypothetical protein n=1 Tax=Ulvibacter sp. MAR_2010_11 TaxID=1250229 RepID=UPI000C2CA7CE|nr:hypothetical protein [Ulvibacter sp. MAR_2010_11]PKA82356.1 hypothetical protein ATE92_0484 [Ulvibacter sp. MAR_2010_11]